MPVSKHYTLLVSKQCGFFVCFSFVCLFCLLYVWCKGNLCWRTVRITPIFFKIFFYKHYGVIKQEEVSVFSNAVFNHSGCGLNTETKQSC